MRIRTEIARAIVLLESREPETRPFFRHVDFDEKKALVVTKRNVVSRPIFLDQFALQQERFRVTAHGMRFEIPNRIKHGARLQIGLRHFRWQEVGADAFVQIARFADVNHPIKPIAHQIHTGFVGHFVHPPLQIRLCQ